MKLVDTFLLLLPWFFTSTGAAPTGGPEDELFKRGEVHSCIWVLRLENNLDIIPTTFVRNQV